MDQNTLIGTQTQKTVTDLDDLIECHDNYINRILQLCLLDSRSQEIVKLVVSVVEVA